MCLSCLCGRPALTPLCSRMCRKQLRTALRSWSLKVAALHILLCLLLPVRSSFICVHGLSVFLSLGSRRPSEIAFSCGSPLGGSRACRTLLCWCSQVCRTFLWKGVVYCGRSLWPALFARVATVRFRFGSRAALLRGSRACLNCPAWGVLMRSFWSSSLLQNLKKDVLS